MEEVDCTTEEQELRKLDWPHILIEATLIEAVVSKEQWFLLGLKSGRVIAFSWAYNPNEEVISRASWVWLSDAWIKDAEFVSVYQCRGKNNSLEVRVSEIEWCTRNL